VAEAEKPEDNQDRVADLDLEAETDTHLMLHLVALVYQEKEILEDRADRESHREVAAEKEAQVEHLADILNTDRDLVILATLKVRDLLQ
tara:strand:- start:140 stop:406 length:267 start_codon:yes stop_codon:yes gene_type:complete